MKGIIGTDSRGGYDAINKHEGPLLGLSNARSALQAFQMREQLRSSGGKLIWIKEEQDSTAGAHPVHEELVLALDFLSGLRDE